MAELKLDAAELRPLVREIVTEVLGELEEYRLVYNGRLAFSEQEAADLLGLNSWQLRDLRLAGKIGHTRIVGKRVRYLLEDLTSYLRQNHQSGTNHGP